MVKEGTDLLEGGECIWMPPGQVESYRGGSSSFFGSWISWTEADLNEGYSLYMAATYMFLRASMGNCSVMGYVEGNWYM